MKDINVWIQKLYDIALTYGLKIIMAILVLIVGLWITKILCRSTKKFMESKKVDVSLAPFLISVMSMLLKLVVVISALAIVGIEMTTLVAMLGAIGLAIGMALSGTLQNFAGGIVILVLKPYRVGHFIEVSGFMGTVKEIQIFSTLVHTPDNKVVVIPNGQLATGTLVNYSKLPTRRVDFVFGIGYEDSMDEAKSIIAKIAKENPKVLENPEPFVAVSALGDSSVDITLRVWVKSSDYWDVHFYMYEQVKKGLDAAGISIPFPQRDVHIYETH